MDALLVPSSNENNALNPYIEFAQETFQENFGRMMSIQLFVSKTQFNIDPLFVDEQWAMMNTTRNDQLILVTTEMMNRLNFSKVSNFLRKLELLFPANRNENNDYSGDGVNVTVTFLALNGAKTKGRGMHNSKQVHMTKSAYKELIMESQTEAARQVRKYYICLEDLFTQYLLYQHAYQAVLSTNRF